MKFQTITPRSVTILMTMLGGYGLFTVCLILASYLRYGVEMAMLVATGATSIAVPVGGLLVLFAASWQHAESLRRAGGASSDHDAGQACDRAPLIDRSIVLVGNGYEHVSIRATSEKLEVETGERACPLGRPADA